jgi:putative NADH-flavin reductase
MDMKILILGASGKTGSILVRKALAAGNEVTAFVRDKDALEMNNSKLTVKVGDARNVVDIKAALLGQDAVVSALGSMKAGDELIVRSTKALIEAAQTKGVKRVIMLSSFLVAPNYKPNFVGKLIGNMMKGMVSDKSSGEDLLKQSDLDWTIVYATSLDRAPAGQTVRVIGQNQTVSMSNGIAREDVATFMLNQLDNSSSVKKMVVITTK